MQAYLARSVCAMDMVDCALETLGLALLNMIKVLTHRHKENVSGRVLLLFSEDFSWSVISLTHAVLKV